MKYTLATCVAALAGLASAFTPANTAQPPSGNPIAKPGLGELVPAGQTYTITWAPDTAEPVTLLLLRGPSENVVPLRTIAEAIPNTGTYVWSVPADLEPDTLRYGIQLIVEGTGQYQYSTQFGISNPGYTGASSSLASTGSTTITLASQTDSYAVFPTASAGGTGGNFSSPILSPTKSMTVPDTIRSTYTRTATGGSDPTTSAEEVSSPTGTGAAALNHVTGGMVGLAVAAAGMLVF